MSEFLQRGYGFAIKEAIDSNEECPISQDTFSDKPLSIYCLYGTTNDGKLISQYFDTAYLYNWLNKCKNDPRSIPTNPITREAIRDDIFNRIEKYFFLMRDIGNVKRTDAKQYFKEFKSNIAKKVPPSNLIDNPYNLALIDSQVFKDEFIKSAKLIVESNPDMYKGNLCNHSRELAYQILKSYDVGTWLIRPSSVKGDDYNVPIVITIINSFTADGKPKYTDYIYCHKRGVGLVEFDNTTIFRKQDICNINDFTILCDLFLELFSLKSIFKLNKYAFIND